MTRAGSGYELEKLKSDRSTLFFASNLSVMRLSSRHPCHQKAAAQVQAPYFCHRQDHLALEGSLQGGALASTHCGLAWHPLSHDGVGGSDGGLTCSAIPAHAILFKPGLLPFQTSQKKHAHCSKSLLERFLCPGSFRRRRGSSRGPAAADDSIDEADPGGGALGLDAGAAAFDHAAGAVEYLFTLVTRPGAGGGGGPASSSSSSSWSSFDESDVSAVAGPVGRLLAGFPSAARRRSDSASKAAAAPGSDLRGSLFAPGNVGSGSTRTSSISSSPAAAGAAGGLRGGVRGRRCP